MTDKKKVEDLSKAFFAIKDIKMEKIDLSPFGGPEGMYAKSMSMKDFQEISKKCTVLKQGVDPKQATSEDYEYSDDFVACNIAASVCDADGNLIFTEDQVPAILEKSLALFQTVSKTVSKMNETMSMKEVEEKAKK